MIKGHWKEEEDQLLLKMVETYGINWPIIAEKWNADGSVLTRSVKQIRERWTNHLNPTISREPWTAQEDERLLQLQAQHGNAWSKISKALPGRSGEGVKTR